MTQPESEYCKIIYDTSKLPRRIITDELRARIAESGEEPPATIYDTWAELLDALELASRKFGQRPAPGFLMQPEEKDRLLAAAYLEDIRGIMLDRYDRERPRVDAWLKDHGINEVGSSGAL